MKPWVFAAVVFLAGVAHGADPSPYAGQEQRAIKSLSTAEIEALGRGDGMGFAKAAELNEYPGPRHVLELADELGLTARQQEQTTQLFVAMQADAIAIGKRVIAAEAELDAMFADGSIDGTSLGAQLEVIADLQARLRFVHLEAHLQQKRILDARQVARYVRLRGYHGEHAGHPKGRSHD